MLEKGPKCEGECSMVNGIKLCTDMLNSAGQDASKEIIFLLGALSTIDPDGPHEALDMVKINNIRCSVVSLSAEGLLIIYGLCVVGKNRLKLERYVIVGKTICSWKDIDIVGKIRLGVKLGWSRRISSTKFL